MLQALTGLIDEKNAGRIAVHEHIVVDFRDSSKPPTSINADEVIRVMEPYLVMLKNAGCDTLAECTPYWLGRAPLILAELSRRTGVNILTNTGWYQSPYLPPEAESLNADEIARIWINEARSGIDDTGLKPGFIKIALNSGKINKLQQKILRAAIFASHETKLAIVSHTVGSEAACEAVSILEKEGLEHERFIWAHADAADGPEVHARLAEKGVWISIDGIGSRHDEHVDMIKRLVEAGFGNKVLISQDSGWYTAGEPMGGNIRAYHTLFTEFIPYAQKMGLDSQTMDAIVTVNAASALSIRR
ncbi:MAG TPA: TatD family hydrolase [Clostridia bacterium]|nr:TatD family hydrolase [Clostridia bacterium]